MSQEGQRGHFQVLGAQEGHLGVFPQFQYCGSSSDGIGLSVVGLPLMESIDGLSVVGLQGLHGILTQ